MSHSTEQIRCPRSIPVVVVAAAVVTAEEADRHRSRADGDFHSACD